MSSETTMTERLLAAMGAGGASAELVATARARFAAVAVLAEACDALHCDLSEREFDFSRRVEENGLRDEGAGFWRGS